MTLFERLDFASVPERVWISTAFVSILHAGLATALHYALGGGVAGIVFGAAALLAVGAVITVEISDLWSKEDAETFLFAFASAAGWAAFGYLAHLIVGTDGWGFWQYLLVALAFATFFAGTLTTWFLAFAFVGHEENGRRTPMSAKGYVLLGLPYAGVLIGIFLHILGRLRPPVERRRAV